MPEMNDCNNCRYQSLGWLKDPCATGAYQLLYSHKCFEWKPMRWWQKIFRKGGDPIA